MREEDAETVLGELDLLDAVGPGAPEVSLSVFKNIRVTEKLNTQLNTGLQGCRTLTPTLGDVLDAGPQRIPEGSATVSLPAFRFESFQLR